MSKNNNPAKDKFYIAYGSNLNLKQMARRCPTAKAVKATCLHNYRLMFRGKGTAVATIEKHKGGKVPILIWQLQSNDEHNLDIYEGFPNLYRKETLKVTVNGRRVQAMVYIMNEALLIFPITGHSHYTHKQSGRKSLPCMGMPG